MHRRAPKSKIQQARMERPPPPYGSLSTLTVTTWEREGVHPQTRMDGLRLDAARPPLPAFPRSLLGGDRTLEAAGPPYYLNPRNPKITITITTAPTIQMILFITVS